MSIIIERTGTSVHQDIDDALQYAKTTGANVRVEFFHSAARVNPYDTSSTVEASLSRSQLERRQKASQYQAATDRLADHMIDLAETIKNGPGAILPWLQKYDGLIEAAAEPNPFAAKLAVRSLQAAGYALDMKIQGPANLANVGRQAAGKMLVESAMTNLANGMLALYPDDLDKYATIPLAGNGPASPRMV